MKFTIASEHRDFFQKQGAVEFEELIRPSHLEELFLSLKEAIAERLSVTLERLPWQHPDKMYMVGRDLWRTHPSLKKLILQNHLAEIAAEILEKKPLRYGYDQFFVSALKNGRAADEERENAYIKMLRHHSTLEELSCLQGISCGLMLCLHSEVDQSVSKKESEGPINVFSPRAGSGVYFSSNVMVDWKQLLHYPNNCYLLIVYTPATSVYFLQEGDLHTHSLKRLGYSFGDKLNDRLHPIVCR
jgi:hypothetical protein